MGKRQSFLARHVPTEPTGLHTMEVLRRRAWLRQGVVALSENDERLSWAEKDYVRQLGEKLYGKREV